MEEMTHILFNKTHIIKSRSTYKYTSAHILALLRKKMQLRQSDLLVKTSNSNVNTAKTIMILSPLFLLHTSLERAPQLVMTILD